MRNYQRHSHQWRSAHRPAGSPRRCRGACDWEATLRGGTERDKYHILPAARMSRVVARCCLGSAGGASSWPQPHSTACGAPLVAVAGGAAGRTRAPWTGRCFTRPHGMLAAQPPLSAAPCPTREILWTTAHSGGAQRPTLPHTACRSRTVYSCFSGKEPQPNTSMCESSSYVSTTGAPHSSPLTRCATASTR